MCSTLQNSENSEHLIILFKLSKLLVLFKLFSNVRFYHHRVRSCWTDSRHLQRPSQHESPLYRRTNPWRTAHADY